MSLYNYWLDHVEDKELHDELVKMSEEKKTNSFYRELSFGTGGLRGILGTGTACMNIYVVQRATQGIAKYIRTKFSRKQWKVAIGYDTRIKSDLFAQTVANVLSFYGIETYCFNEPIPTPCVSYATRELSCCMGIVITASHNPKEYNGYKVYGKDGCQITDKIAKEIYSKIKNSKYFFEYISNIDLIHTMPKEIYDSYLKKVSSLSIRNIQDKSIKIVYTPLHGSGLKPVTDILKLNGYKNIVLVHEQTSWDGNFPTCPKPNPEEPSAMKLGIECAKKNDADIILATDPDCDRVSIAIKEDKEYRIISANELGCLLLDYICQFKARKGDIFCKTIVTTELAELIAQHYHLKTINTLTGFKYIGEQIANLEKIHEEDKFIFGFEESCGFLSGTFVRDKDAVIASLLICEMASYYSSINVSLSSKLDLLYSKYGYCLNAQDSFIYEGAKGQKIIENIMNTFRYEVQNIGKYNIIIKKDYLQGVDNLPKSNVIKLHLENNQSLIIRTSGTEPKIKIYYFIIAQNKEFAEKEKEILFADIEKIISQYDA